jgi:hypothetical protein
LHGGKIPAAVNIGKSKNINSGRGWLMILPVKGVIKPVTYYKLKHGESG